MRDRRLKQLTESVAAAFIVLQSTPHGHSAITWLLTQSFSSERCIFRPASRVEAVKCGLTKLTRWTLILALCCALAAAQEQVPLTRVTTNFVEIHVVAQDKKGNAVLGLTQSDFRVFDNSVEASIAVFAVDASRRLEALGDPRPDVVSNRLGAQSGQANATAILIDALNTDFNDQSQVRGQLIRFLEQMRSGERAAVFLLTSRLVMVFALP
ncbi:MAG TPA: hypothetical protein VH351_05245 [Bryobacteraceae bacterium]|jgi:hypothetical protein|nr:hypothetical protein [Bryobacteraceae bacterium]